MKFQDKLQMLRKSKGLSQEKLGYEIGVSRQAITKWENGSAMPEVEKVILLSEFFHVTTDYLLKEYIEEPEKLQAVEQATDPKKKISIRLKIGIPALLVSTVFWLVLWVLSQLYPVYSVTGSGKPLIGFFGFLGYHQILHESYAVAGIGCLGMALLIVELILRMKRKEKGAIKV